MPLRNKARKSTGPRATSTPKTNSINQYLRTRGSTQVANNSSAQGDSDSSDSDVPTQRLRRRTQNSTIQSTPGTSGLSSQAKTSRATVASDDDGQSTLRLPNGQNQSSSPRSDTTSDSDEAPGRIKSNQAKNKPSKKRRIIGRKHSTSEEDVQPTPSTSRIPSASRNVSSSHNKSVSSPNKTLQSRNMFSLVNKCVYYLLVADQKKYPIKKSDILKHVLAESERKLCNNVINEASTVLKKTYGLEMVKSVKRKDEYLIINILKPDLGIQDFIDCSPTELKKRGFLFYLLTIIFMNEQSITNDELTSALKPLGIDLNARSSRFHPVFDDVHNYLTKELVKQNYLELNLINKEPSKYELSWGERAYQEVVKKDLLDFACKILDTRPEEWILQNSDASRQEPAA